ncbi:MAG: hypothetical protein IKA10_02070 [Oscillospiraceae bacterium]|nr:hypothetical protein [Oscillospiraceae bacterium]
MNCPYCNKEMKKGAISAKSPPLWTTRNKATIFKRKDEISLCNFVGTEFSAAYYCDVCNKIIVDLNETVSYLDLD